MGFRSGKQGEQPTDYRPLSSIGKGIFELRDQDDQGWYGVVYLSRVNDVIHVLHSFEKHSLEIPKKDANTAKQNLRSVTAYLREEKKNAKQKT